MALALVTSGSQDVVVRGRPSIRRKLRGVQGLGV